MLCNISNIRKHFAKLECYLCKPVVYIFILFTSAEELYIAYNNISELSQLTWLDHLEVLDLEGNNIEDINQMEYLGLCCKLSRLTVEGNLICLKPNAEAAEVKTWFTHIVLIFGSAFLVWVGNEKYFSIFLLYHSEWWHGMHFPSLMSSRGCCLQDEHKWNIRSASKDSGLFPSNVFLLTYEKGLN